MTIESSQGHSRPLKNHPIEMDRQTRIKRSVKSWGMFFGLALLSIPLPGVHFFLVPSFIIYALYAGRTRFKERYQLILAGETCPSCNHPLNESELYFSEDANRLYCYECRSQLRLG